MENSFIIQSYVSKHIIWIFLSKDPWSPPASWTRWGPTSSSLPRRGPASTTASSPSKFDLIHSTRKMNYNSSQVCGNYEIIKISRGWRLNFNYCLQNKSGIPKFTFSFYSIFPVPRAAPGLWQRPEPVFKLSFDVYDLSRIQTSNPSASEFFDLLTRGGIFIPFSSKPCISIQECKLLSSIRLVYTTYMIQPD